MDLLKLIREINWKALIIGAALCAFLATFGYNNHLEWLVPFSSIGLLYVGYEGKSLKMGTILGAIAALPLFLVTIYGGFGSMNIGTYSLETLIVLALIACLVVGAIIGFVGAYFYRNRQKAIEKKENKNKIGKNNKK